MNINWSTVFFQIVNFWIIVWILKKYLFKPVLSSMDKREQTIRERLRDAEEAKKNAEEEKQRLLKKIDDVEKAKSAVMADAYKKADAEYATLLKTFNAEMAGKRKAFEEQITDEREFLRTSIKEIAGNTIVKTVATALSELADANIQSAIIEKFISKAKSGTIEKTDDLKKYYEKNKKVSVHTSFEINETEKKQIKSIISEVVGEDVKHIDFAEDKGIICGIEVICPPLLISFGMDTYIVELQKNLDDGLAELTKTKKIDSDE